MTNRDLLAALTGLLARVESELRANTSEYRGTDSFKPSNVNAIFTDKTLKLRKDSERADLDEARSQEEGALALRSMRTNSLSLTGTGMSFRRITEPVKKRRLCGCSNARSTI